MDDRKAENFLLLGNGRFRLLRRMNVLNKKWLVCLFQAVAVAGRNINVTILASVIACQRLMAAQ
jgi:hypothetical protein